MAKWDIVPKKLRLLRKYSYDQWIAKYRPNKIPGFILEPKGERLKLRLIYHVRCDMHGGKIKKGADIYMFAGSAICKKCALSIPHK